MTKREAAIVSAYTGYLIGNFEDFHLYAEEIMGRQIFTLELPSIAEELKNKSKKDFMSIKIDNNKPPESLYHSPYERDSSVDFDAIEKALGFRLFGWQKSYILYQGFRQMGRTTAEILQMLFDKRQYDIPIDFSKPAKNHQRLIFRYQFREIWEKLNDAGIKMRPVFWTIEDKKKHEVESKDVSARSKERTIVKMDPYRYAREAFAEYEAEHHICLDCSSCRYDDINEVYYCRRSYSIIDKPDEISTCDNFELVE